ncbi:MAG: hypothetical protein GX304_01555 [Clostridiales bacterium]|jgi:hypothetical protein|nr:hypothetical protein [Clostridiales bacterium]
MRRFADFSDTKTVIALLIAAFGIFLLWSAPKLAKGTMRRRFPQLKEGEKAYEEKFYDIAIKYKIAAAFITVAACVLSLL